MGPELRCYRANRDLTRCGIVTKEGVFRSRWYRGLESGMEWLRLTFQADRDLRVRVYAADAPAGDVAPADETPALQRMSRDLCLYGVRGQYLSFTAEPAGALESYALYFPGRSIAEGLPAILQTDPLLRRLLAVCQSGYLDLNQQIRRFPRRMNPQDPDALPGLAHWIGASRWAVDQAALEQILPEAVRLGQMRGTRQGLIQLARLVTGCDLRVLEQPGKSPAVILLVPAQVKKADLNRLQNLLPDFIPMGLTYQLIRLEEGGLLDGYTYLDENVVLAGEPSAARLDGPGGNEVILG